jgi:hypothetical protein
VARYRVNVAAQHDTIVLGASGHLDAGAGRHLLELARIAINVFRRAVRIDLAAVHSCTPGGARLLAHPELARLPGAVAVHGLPVPGPAAKPPRSDARASGDS